jgi:hypothetical protein
MGKPCTVCVHPDHIAIDAALEAGQSLRGTAAAYGVSKTALHRHWHAHVFEGLPFQSGTAGETLAPNSPTVKRSFWSRVKTIAKWVVGIGVGVGFAWLAVTAPPTSGAQGAQSAPRA